jgi:hypothetical protein
MMKKLGVLLMAILFSFSVAGLSFAQTKPSDKPADKPAEKSAPADPCAGKPKKKESKKKKAAKKKATVDTPLKEAEKGAKPATTATTLPPKK